MRNERCFNRLWDKISLRRFLSTRNKRHFLELSGDLIEILDGQPLQDAVLRHDVSCPAVCFP